jgi:hypothetical protein
MKKKHNLSLIGWHKIYNPISLGGLGIRRMELHNKALLAKMG